MAMMYRALVGIDYPGGRVEAGDETDALPPKAAKWLSDDGLIQPASEPVGEPLPVTAVVVTEVSSPDPDGPAKPSRQSKAASAPEAPVVDEPAPTPPAAPDAPEEPPTALVDAPADPPSPKD